VASVTHLTVHLYEVDDTQQRCGANRRITIHVIVTTQNNRFVLQRVNAVQNEFPA
jgi:hypothetical protein